ncbi:MAG: DUF1830 domain-containing protein [Cyanobacteria bacterium J06560_2]
MAQILDPLPSDASAELLCCYVNVTSKIQIARVTNIADWYFERVVFPGQRLLFEAPLSALLEIHTGMMASAILSDTIPCDRLAIDADGNQLNPPHPTSQGTPAEENAVTAAIASE